MRRVYVFGSTPRVIAVTEDDHLVRFHRDVPDESMTESIHLGRVVRVVNGMQAAFVDIGAEKNGFLPLNEKSEGFNAPRLSEGMHVAVQVKKDAHDGKGAFLTRDITLCGQYVLVMPCCRYIGVSSRITAEADRRRLKQLGKAIAADRFGIVMRAASLEADEDLIAAEAGEMLAQWDELHRKAATAHAPSLLFRPRTLLEALLDDELPRGIDELVTDDSSVMIEGVPARRPRAGETEALLQKRNKALERRVWLDCGGNLIIDPCEAMTVIDVNTAKNTGRRALEETILRTNLEAADEIARQLRLRAISGIILIDMIDMPEESQREAVLERLRTALAADPVKTVVHGFTSLGLIEMTRKKTRVTLRDEWTQPCPHCRGTGRVRKEEPNG